MLSERIIDSRSETTSHKIEKRETVKALKEKEQNDKQWFINVKT
jgi:hypothetical protein